MHTPPNDREVYKVIEAITDQAGKPRQANKAYSGLLGAIGPY